jgi:hypothetical protein
MEPMSDSGASHGNLLGEPPPTLLPDDDEAHALLEGGAGPRQVAAAYPTYALAWAMLAEQALDDGDEVAALAYARTGYHRSLDQLRRNGWKGHGPVPWEHAGNQGFLRSVNALRLASAALGEDDEATRCALFLRECSPVAAAELGA